MSRRRPPTPRSRRTRERRDARGHRQRPLHAATTKQIQLDLASAESRVIAWEQQHRTVRSLSASDVAAVLDHAGDLAKILKDAEREARARLYRTLGLQLLLDPVGNRVEARSQLRWWRGQCRTSGHRKPISRDIGNTTREIRSLTLGHVQSPAGHHCRRPRGPQASRGRPYVRCLQGLGVEARRPLSRRGRSRL